MSDVDPHPSHAAADAPLLERVVAPVTGWVLPDFREVLRRADLVYFLARRDVAIRYKQTVLGAFWVILQPVLLAVIFSVFLGHLARVPSGGGVPYPVFAVSGLTLWMLFTLALSRCSDSLVLSEALVSKVYFPRIIIPLAAVLPPLVDFALGFVVVLATMLVYSVTPALQIVLIPALVVLTLGLALGAGLWLSALFVLYRDVGLIVPFVIMIGLFVTPIIYPTTIVPAGSLWLYELNPLVGIFQTYRWMLFAGAPAPGLALVVSIVAAAVLLYSGSLYFRRAEARFADFI